MYGIQLRIALRCLFARFSLTAPLISLPVHPAPNNCPGRASPVVIVNEAGERELKIMKVSPHPLKTHTLFRSLITNS